MNRVTRCCQESLTLWRGCRVGIGCIDVYLCWPSFLPGRLCHSVTVLHEPSQLPLWGPLLCPSVIIQCLRCPSSAPWRCQVMVPTCLLSAFSTPLYSLFCVFLSKERTHRKCGKRRHHGRKFMCLGAFQHWWITSLRRSVHAVLSHLFPQGISLTHTPHLCSFPGTAVTNEHNRNG